MAHLVQNDRGPLIPGQTVSVNKYQVQIERYLSKGGYAYVYLVKTAQPVHGTTHHVLKRIAVPTEIMLGEVKKEVDIMRILRGHPNIVQLIDAAWHRLPNGVYEVFILMEFCAGGGIIDMMNRRLRERLTEAEILQIFVDVCEGVAAMHNLRPPLLHRDLKVENILQSSDTLYKLCDFGSATPASPRPPANTQEIRALEADLNRHTTLQYRAPEMVDLYLRRPVDEKADIWALGVLLYKLCYYTTPFEEHGPLAILNVQYKIPSYPVYSSAMNSLIASMLREHGAHRPSAFDLLDVVHRMRGTKSRYTYKRTQQQIAPLRSTATAPSNGLESVVSHRPPSANAASQPKNAGVQAREKVLEAIAPMRRGRPTAASRSSSPEKTFGESFRFDEEEEWKKVKTTQAAVRGHRSGLASPTAWGGRSGDAWAGPSKAQERSDHRKPFQSAADFNLAKGFGDSFDSMLGSSTSAAAAAAAAAATPPVDGTELLVPTYVPSRSSGSGTSPLAIPNRARDAFYGLGISPSEKPPPPTLAETRRLRTGLATSASPNSSDLLSNRLDVPGSAQRSNISPKPSSSAITTRPSPSPSPQPPWKSSQQAIPSTKQGSSSLSAEERFPSLEDLDRTLSPGSSSTGISTSSAQAGKTVKQAAGSPSLPPRPFLHATLQNSFTNSQPQLSTALSHLAPAKVSLDGVRSEQVTGAAMREPREKVPERFTSPIAPKPQLIKRPSLVRKHQSSNALKHPETDARASLERRSSPSPSSDSSSEPNPMPPSKDVFARTEPRDWLTGSDDEQTAKNPETPFLRQSPSKRTSIIQRDPVVQSSPQEAVAGMNGLVTTQRSESPSPAVSSWRKRLDKTVPAMRQETTGTKPLIKPKPAHAVKPLIPAPLAPSPSKGGALTENWSPIEPPIEPPTSAALTSDSGDEGLEPEDVEGGRKLFAARQTAKKQRHGRQSSVHELVDLWGGGVEKKVPLLVQAEKVPARTEQKVPAANGFSVKTQVLIEESRRAVAAATARSPPPLSSLQPPSTNFTGKRSQSPNALRPPSTDVTDKPRSQSPGRLTSTKSSSPTRSGPARTRKPSSYNNPSGPPTTSVNPSKARPRPQSMILSSTTIKSSGEPPVPIIPSATLAAPPDPRMSRQQRRTSISNMVQKYEAMGGRPTTPAASTKPPLPPLKVVSHETASATLSPRTLGPTPLQARSKSHAQTLGLPEIDVPGLPVGLSAAHTTGIGLPGLAHPRSPVTTSARTQVEKERPPSPEKPYQGVGRLIDQWQRKTEGDTPSRGAGGKAAGGRKADDAAGAGTSTGR